MSKHLKKNTQVYIWVGIIAVLLVAFLIAPTFQNEVNRNIATHSENLRDDVRLVFPQGEIQAQLANTLTARELGLSYRDKIGDNEGMLFVFDKPDIYAFWMKDMNFPLDMVWIDSGKKVVAISENISTSTFPTSFYPPSPAMYVLEINARAAKNFGMATGTVLSF